MVINVIIFDMDGTLWNTSESTLKAANNVARRHDDIKEFSMETIQKGMGLNAVENAYNYMPYLDQEKAVKFIGEVNMECSKVIAEEGATIYDGVVETLKELSKKYKLGIVTNNNDEYVKTFLKLSNLTDYITDYMGTATYKITKGEAIKELALRNNEPNSFYVGDIKKDMIATKEANQTFIHAKYGFEPDLECEYYINDIKELEEVINKIKNN